MEAIIGVVIGGIITLLGNIVNNHYSLKKQKEQFESEKEANKEEWLRVEQKAESENIRDIYKHAHSALSSFIAEINQEGNTAGLNSGSNSPKVHEILEWFAVIALRFPNDSELSQKIESFSNHPVEYNAIELRDKLKELVQRESSFFLQKPKTIPQKVEPQREDIKKEISFEIDNEFRRKQSIKGNEIERTHKRDIEWKNLSSSQREKFVRIYFDRHNTIPSNLNMYVPTLNKNNNEIELYGHKWQAKLNPHEFDTSEIISQWENDFIKAEDEANRMREANSDSN